MTSIKDQLKTLPDAPGVYQFRDATGKMLYIGKATSLKKRVGSYFSKAHDDRIQAMVDQIATIHINTTRSALEALLLEAQQIKKQLPPYNVMEKDDKTFANIAITDEPIPRVIVTRPTHKEKVKLKYIYGPYTSAATAYTAIKLIRRIFPFHTQSQRRHPGLSRIRSDSGQAGMTTTLCFDAKIGLCPGVCGGKISMADYRKSLTQLRLFLEGKRERVMASLEREMKDASKNEQYERAGQIRDTLHALEHIHDVALLTNTEFGPQPRGVASRTHSYYIPHRVEAYDISHVFGEDAVGSMVVFTNGKIDSAEYRQFRIRGDAGRNREINDPKMIKEVLYRRLNHPEWPYPDLFLIDGGSPQLHAAQQVLKERNLTIPVAALAKGPERKRADLYSADPAAKLIPRTLLVHLREESHRFAIRYHRLLKRKGLVRK